MIKQRGQKGEDEVKEGGGLDRVFYRQKDCWMLIVSWQIFLVRIYRYIVFCVFMGGYIVIVVVFICFVFL